MKKNKPDIRTFFAKKPKHEDPSGEESVQVQEDKLPEAVTEEFSTTSKSMSQQPSIDPAPALSHGPQDQPALIIVHFPVNNKGRRFAARYYNIFQWLEYSAVEDGCYCFPCQHFVPLTSVRQGETIGNGTFIDRGFSKWKDASALFQQHEKGERHRSSMLAWGEFKNRSLHKISAASLLDSQRSGEIEENRRHIKTLLKVTHFLGLQGLAFRGHSESEGSSNQGNFKELLNLMTEDDPSMKEKMSRRYGHYSSHEYQNDLIGVFSAGILKNIVVQVKEAKFFALMADETKDISKSEQLAILIRYIDHESKVNERAFALRHLKDCSAEGISRIIEKVLIDEGLDLKFCIGQCYNGASVMSGLIGRVQAKLKERAPNATYLHCYAHHLNLVLVHALGGNDEVQDFFSTLQNLYNFISNSATRHELFVDAQQRLQQPVLNLEQTVPTRWF